MEYISQVVESKPGLSQEEALKSLQDHPKFKSGTKITSFRRKKDHWVAKLEVPKKAVPIDLIEDEVSENGVVEELEPVEDDDDHDDDDHDDDHGEDEDHEEDEVDKLDQIVELLEKVLDAVSNDEEGPEEEEELIEPVDEVLDLAEAPVEDLGETPLGSPAFSSVQEMASKVPTFTASSNQTLTVKEAKADLDKTYGPHYKVKQIRRKDDGLHALLSVR